MTDNTTNAPEMVTQADRDAAADFMSVCAPYLGDCGMKNSVELALRQAFARRRHQSASPSASGEAIEELRWALAECYVQGANDVHREWQENPGEAPRGDPDFKEASLDCADAALDPFSSAVRGLSSDFLAALHPNTESGRTPVAPDKERGR